MGGSGFWKRRSRRRAADASLLRRFAASSIDGAGGLALLDAARRATGAPSLWASDSGRLERRDRAITLALKAATVAGDVLLDGRTLGRGAAGIRLQRDSGEPLDVRTAFIREFATYLTAPVFWLPVRVLARRNGTWGLAGMTAVWLGRRAVQVADPHRRSLEDLIAGTRMVRSAPRRRR